MDPLSVAASIAGLATAAGEVAKILKPYVSALSEPIPPIALQVYAEVESTGTILTAVQRLVDNLGVTGNGSLIQVNDIVAVFTDGVLVYSDLEETIGELRVDLPADSIPLRSRLIWARKESKINTLLVRLHGFKVSINLILNLLNCATSQLAEQQAIDLQENIETLLEGNQALARRLLMLERTMSSQISVAANNDSQINVAANNDATHVENSVSTILEDYGTETPTISFFQFEADLQTSRAYRRAKHVSMDFSFRSSKAPSSVGSMLSGLSLSELSNISIIALPIYAEDLANPQHYNFRHSLDVTVSGISGQDWSTKTTSIYQHCQLIRQLLLQLPEFQTFFQESDELYKDAAKDPLRDLKNVCKRGTPLLVLMELLGRGPFYLPRYSNTRTRQNVAIYEFITGCNALHLGPPEAFTLLDLVGDGYIGFFKVVKTLESVLAELIKIGILKPESLNGPMPSYPSAFKDMGDRVNNFLDSERRYVEQMRMLLRIKETLSQDVFNGNQSHAVFGPFNQIVESQVQLLVSIETEALKQPFDQRWSIPFIAFLSASEVLQAYISLSSERRAILHAEMAKREQNPNDPYLASLQQFAALSALPFMHVKEYEKFIESLITLFPARRDEKDLGLYDLETSAIIAISSIQAGIAHAEELLALKEDLLDLKNRVQDWERHKTTYFGDLLLCGRFFITDANIKSTQNFHVYLFETVLLICNEKPIRGAKLKDFRSKIFSQGARPAQSAAVLLIKGQIFLKNITQVSQVSSDDSYRCCIVWQSGTSSEGFDISFLEQKQMLQWAERIRSLSMKNVTSKQGL